MDNELEKRKSGGKETTSESLALVWMNNDGCFN